MKISEFRNEAGLEVIADIIEPLSVVFRDQEFRKMVEGGSVNRFQVVGYLLKNHAKPVIEILARLSGTTPGEYDKSVIGMTRDLLDLLNDEELRDFFPSQGQKSD